MLLALTFKTLTSESFCFLSARAAGVDCQRINLFILQGKDKQSLGGMVDTKQR